MSPARISLGPEDLSASEVPLGGLWSAKGEKRQRRQARHADSDLDLVDDLKMLWETRWKFACKRQLHPFQDASYLDVAPLMISLIQRGVTSAHSPLYTDAFLTLAETLVKDARASLLSPGNVERASQLFLRACALLRVARFPYSPSSHRDTAADVCLLKRKAFELQKAYYLEAAAGLSGLNSPLDEILIPHVHDPLTHPELGRRGDMGIRGHEPKKVRRPQIPAFLRVPLETLLTGRQCPAALVLSRDRTGSTRTCEEVLSRGWACVVVEVPGEGDCPVTAEEGSEAEGRLWRSVLDWMASMFFFDMERVVIMAEGEVATRVASVHGGKVNGVIAYVDEQFDDGRALDEKPLCRILVVNGGIETAESSGLWTPPLLEQEAESMALCAYEAGSTECIGQLETTDVGKVYGWMEAVMDSRASEIEEGLAAPFDPARPKDKQVQQWPSMEFSPPNSDVEVASSLGSSVF